MPAVRFLAEARLVPRFVSRPYPPHTATDAKLKHHEMQQCAGALGPPRPCCLPLAIGRAQSAFRSRTSG